MAALTKTQKDDLVVRIMDDIPQVDYEAQGEKFILEAVLAVTPAKVVALWKNAETRPYVNNARLGSECGRIKAVVPYFRQYGQSGDLRDLIGEDAYKTVQEICRKNTQQRDARVKLAKDLYANLESIRTNKAFRERFPDLAKYLPEEEASPSTLPATTALMDELKAAGLKLEPEANG